jgi:DNA-binding cell septation regulator SpoVG
MYQEKFEISDIEIAPVPPKNGLVAFASFHLNSQFYVGNIAVFTSPSSPGGFRLVYPTKMGASCFRPLSRQVGDAIQGKVIARYQELLKELLDDEEDLNAYIRSKGNQS